MDDTDNEQIQRLFEILSATKEGVPPYWELVAVQPIRGLTEICFSPDSKYIFVISSQGRGVFCSNEGYQINRDPYPYKGWYNCSTLTAKGIEPLEKQTLHVAGLHGGSLPLTTHLGNSLDIIHLNPFKVDIYFCQKNGSAFHVGCSKKCYSFFRL